MKASLIIGVLAVWLLGCHAATTHVPTVFQSEQDVVDSLDKDDNDIEGMMVSPDDYQPDEQVQILLIKKDADESKRQALRLGKRRDDRQSLRLGKKSDRQALRMGKRGRQALRLGKKADRQAFRMGKKADRQAFRMGKRGRQALRLGKRAGRQAFRLG